MTTNSPIASAEEQTVRPVTVLEDSKNYTIKHPLQHTWKLWYKEKVASEGSGANGSDWQNALKSVDDISTVEDFWGWFNVMPKPSDVKHGGDIFLFHQGIEPSWEDPAHTTGSSLAWTLPKPSNSGNNANAPNNNNGNDNREYLDYWLNAMLACIGCGMETGYAYVTGVQFAARDRGSRITLWLRTSDAEIVRTVEAEFRKALTEGLSYAQAVDLHFKWEEFSNQLAKQHSHQRRPAPYSHQGHQGNQHSRGDYNSRGDHRGDGTRSGSDYGRFKSGSGNSSNSRYFTSNK